MLDLWRQGILETKHWRGVVRCDCTQEMGIGGGRGDDAVREIHKLLHVCFAVIRKLIQCTVHF